MKWMNLLLVLTIASTGVAEDWFTWRGPNGNGISNETGLQPGKASILWTEELGVGHSSVSVKDGKLYSMGNKDDKDIVYCLDAKTGQKIWDYSYDCEAGNYDGPRATPVVDGKTLYTVSRNGLLICLDAESGKKKWETDVLDETGNDNVRWGVSSSAVIVDDLILLNIGKSGTAINKSSGQVKWKSLGQQSYASPVIFEHKGKTLAAFFTAEGLVIVDAKSGKKIDDYEWKTKYDINGADPLVFGDKIFISSGYGRGCALLDFSSGKLKKVWENKILKNQFSSSIVVDGFIYGIDGQTKKKGFLRCIDSKDGSEAWNMKIGFGSLIAADGKIIALDESGTLYFAELTPKKYSEISTFKTGLSKLCWTPPIVANGVVYCRNDQGTLVAVSIK